MVFNSFVAAFIISKVAQRYFSFSFVIALARFRSISFLIKAFYSLASFRATYRLFAYALAAA